jgi:hypothetical protein
MNYNCHAVRLFAFGFHQTQLPVMEKKPIFFLIFYGKVYIYYRRGYDEYIYIMELASE